jgi:hypothetical protein
MSKLIHHIILLLLYWWNYHQKLKLHVCVPAPANLYLAVFILPGFVAQIDPSYSSVAAVMVEFHHQKLKLPFEYHNLLNVLLPYLNQEDYLPKKFRYILLLTLHLL